MEQKLVGREVELEDLNKYLNSERSEFIAVYGRRRVGKTFLIRKAVKDHLPFHDRNAWRWQKRATCQL